MKTTAKKIKGILVILVFLLVGTNKVKAQYVLTNTLNCAVEVNYEMWDIGCNVCIWGTITLQATSSVTLTNCNFSDICIVVTEVGGTKITWYNHANSDGSCHGPQGTTGQSSTGQCSGGWNTSITPGPNGVWTIF
ncbi:MAG: hypothetical protein MUF75_05875 [Bacteroidia bacterium]|jgi:hypothetical protein|nr:hypothetical protein [Bacteroidia bacterium]